MDAEKVIRDQIAALEQQIAVLKYALHAIQESKSKVEPGMRFFDWRPLDATRVLLKEHGGKMHIDKLVESMVNAGITHGRKRGLANIRISLVKNTDNGNLIQRGDFVELPKS